MLARVAIAGVLLTGCFHPEPQPGAPCGDPFACPDGLVCSLATQTCELPSTTSDADTRVDGPVSVLDAPVDACTSFSVLYDTCTFVAGPPVLLSTSATIDTAAPSNGLFSSLELVTIGGHEVLVASVASLAIIPGGSLSVVGPRAFVIVVFGSATIDGTVTTAAATRTTCMAQAQVGGDDANGAGGGGGGGFQGSGGAGGKGDHGAIGGAHGGSEGLSFTLLGGCAGGNGGQGQNPGSTPAMGGAGGGAIAVVARDAISVGGAITAPGIGGRHAVGLAAGGAGGGSGGMIYLEAQTIIVTGAVAANGGGGGGGTGPQSLIAGNGLDGQPNATPATGGDASMGGTAGGLGSGGVILTGASAQEAGGGGSLGGGGGGGGGGGAGYLLVRSPSDATFVGPVSPPPLML